MVSGEMAGIGFRHTPRDRSAEIVVPIEKGCYRLGGDRLSALAPRVRRCGEAFGKRCIQG